MKSTLTTRREFLGGAAASAAALAVGCSTEDSPVGSGATRKPNIVFIMADDLGYGHLGCYGQQHIRTPNIDRLAAEGMRFTDAYAGCTVCAPSRSTLMTGYHTGHAPVRANTGGAPLLPEDVTVAEVLKQAGYATGIFGKWGLGAEGTTGVPNKQGFDEFFGYLHQIHAHYYYPEYLLHNEQRYPLPGNANGQRGQYSHDEIAGKALEFVRAHKDEPFFLYVPFTIPHAETLAPEDSVAEYDGKFPEEFYYDQRRHYSDQAKPNATFAGMVTRMDRDVGRIMDTIKELGLDDDTIVFFTSDNGSIEGFGIRDDIFHGSGPLRGYKRDMYEGGLRAPMIARWPGRIESGAVSDLPWAFWDVLPTLAEIAGATPPDGIDGISVAPTLLGEAATGRSQQRHEYLYWENPVRNDLLQAARSGDWKAVKLGKDAPVELYNLKEDPGETNNVAAGQPDVLAKMEQILAEARTEPRPQPEPGWNP